MAERINMAEEGGIEASQPVVANNSEAAITPQRSYSLTPEYDPKREDYQMRKEGQEIVWTDSLTGKEVARHPTIEGGAVSLEMELDPTGKGPEEMVDIMQRIYVMDFGIREDHKKFYQEAADSLQEFAQKGKLLGTDAGVVKKEKDLTAADKAAIDAAEAAIAGQGASLTRLLDNLDSAEWQLTAADGTLADEGFKELFSAKGWKELKDKRDKLTADIKRLKQEITGITPLMFLEEREKLQQQIKAVKKIRKAEALEKQNQEAREQQAEPEAWERDLETILLERENSRPVLPVPPEERTFAEQLSILEQNFNTVNAKEELSWFFHEARELGIVQDLDEKLEHKYQEWANTLMPHQEQIRDGSIRRVPGKSFAEVEDEIIEFFEALVLEKFDNNSNKTNPQYVEQSARWNLLKRKGLSDADNARFQGVRLELARRAQVQMENSLSNMALEIKGQNPVVFPDNRISGEWNVRVLERLSTLRRERQTLEAGLEPLFQEESYYRINLLGDHKADIEAGANQAANNIIESATTFDINAIQQRMEMLLKAIRQKSTDLQRSERISKDEAEKLIVQMEDAVTNKIDFFILDWAGQNLQGELFTSWLEQRMRIRGVEKVRETPYMNDGMVGIGLLLLLSEEFKLYHRPQGFKGQVFDDDTVHKYIRVQLEEKMKSILMKFELKGTTSKEKDETKKSLRRATTKDQFLANFDVKNTLTRGKDFMTATKEEKNNLVKNLERMSPAEVEKMFRTLTPEVRVKIRRHHYELVSGEVQGKVKNATFQDLDRLRMVRKDLALEQNNYQEARRKAASAFTIAKQAMNVFGESADLGEHAIIMKNGDFIRKGEVVLFYKYAILQAGKNYGETYGAEDNSALIRWRSRMWIQRWKDAGLDRKKAKRTFDKNDVIVDKEGKVIKDNRVVLKDGQVMEFTLKEGFEETGLTEKEWDGFAEAVKRIREKGYNATITTIKRDEKGRAIKDLAGNIVTEETSFEEIMKMDELKPVMNNYLADYQSSESQINNAVTLEQAAKGKLVPIEKILSRLGYKPRERIKGDTTQQRIDNLTQKIEDSRALHAELDRLVDFEATHGLPGLPLKAYEEKDAGVTDPRMLSFSPDRIDYALRNRSWLVGRLHDLKGFWYTNLRRTTPRGVDLVHALPFSLGSLAQEMAFDDTFDLMININTSTNGMESVDSPALVQYAQRNADMAALRSACEGGIDPKEGKKWGWLEKPFVDANSLWKLFQATRVADIKGLLDIMRRGGTEITQDVKEAIVNHFQETTLGRFIPILVGTEKLLGEDRQAISSGAGFDENEKFALRKLEWVLSEKGPSEEHGAREEAGMAAFSEIQELIHLIITPNSYSKGSSFWNEIMRKLTPSHSIRLPSRAPSPTYLASAA